MGNTKSQIGETAPNVELKEDEVAEGLLGIMLVFGCTGYAFYAGWKVGTNEYRVEQREALKKQITQLKDTIVQQDKKFFEVRLEAEEQRQKHNDLLEETKKLQELVKSILSHKEHRG